MYEPNSVFGLSTTALSVMVIRPRPENIPCGYLIEAYFQAALTVEFNLSTTKDSETQHTRYRGEYAGYPIEFWSYSGVISLYAVRDVPSEQQAVGIRIAQQGVLKWYAAFLQFVTRDREIGEVIEPDGSSHPLLITAERCLFSGSPRMVKAFLWAAFSSYERGQAKPDFANEVFRRVAQSAALSGGTVSANSDHNLAVITPHGT